MCKKCLSLLAVSLTLFGCTTEKTWDFQTDYFSIGINDKGYITSMKNTTVSPNSNPLRCCRSMIVKRKCIIRPKRPFIMQRLIALPSNTRTVR